MNRKAMIIISILLLTILNGCSTAKKFKVMLPISWIGMEEVKQGVYVDNEMSVSQRQDLLSSIKQGREKVKHIWGKVESNPEVYACSTESCFQSFGGSSNKANAVWGRTLLSPRALSPEMIAHEWSHSELYQRLDSVLVWRNIPQWFDDGFAVYVSGYEGHGDSVWAKIKQRGIEPPKLDALVTLKQWVHAYHKYINLENNPEKLNVVYTTAGHEIKAWYHKVGLDGLLYVIQEVKDGKDFEEAYYNAEKNIQSFQTERKARKIAHLIWVAMAQLCSTRRYSAI